MDFSRPIERGDGDCAVFIPFVREGLFVTKWNGGRRRGWKIKKRKKKGKKGRGNCVRIVSYFWNKGWLIPCQRIRISKRIRPADSPISRVIVESQTQTPIHSGASTRGWRRLNIYIYIFISAFQISGVKKKGRKKKFFSISLAAWQYSRIYLKRVESSRERGSRQRTVALDEG